MTTLYVENLPKDLYQALRKRAANNHRSVAAEVRTLLEHRVASEKELKKRRAFVSKLDRLRASVVPAEGTFPAAEEMIREDRDR